MSLATILVIEHEATCPPALVGTWLGEAGCALDVVRPYLGEQIPAIEAYAGLLVLGGTMGAGDDHRVEWLEPVRELVREAEASGVPTLGICLGHQLIATALGGTVGVNPNGQQLGVLEIGWTAQAPGSFLGTTLPARGIQWNNDIVTSLPPGAEVLAQTPAGEPQVVRFAPTIWGVQLHPEADEHVVAVWAEGDQEAHTERGIDQRAFLDHIAAARAELDDAWRPVLVAFADLARGRMAATGAEAQAR
ncbi:GMP synthase (glutamine-hydrolyzing) [Nocardioides daedukensis]|uniref:GMP synthase (Glutamine-hydrolyzing) n=1 Tax=Nocardioides daedukensis TaxID=634462 RepID=A0A7Y9S546_9ACTN|nr:GMP synthase (glutamine-hydrolyzing) [Nocardioides daedukensis]